MIDKIKTLDLISMNEEDSKTLLGEMLELTDDGLKDCINAIVDNIKYEETDIESIDDLSISYKTIFSNERIKSLMEELLDEYDSHQS